MGSGEQLEEAEVDRLGAAILEQRRLSHMLRERGAEIEALRGQRERFAAKERRALETEEGLRRRLRELDQQLRSASADRDRVAAELKESRYETRRAERRVEKTEQDAAEARARAERSQEQAEERIAAIGVERERIAVELKRAEYEARRAERRVAKVERAFAEAGRRNRLQLDSLAAELRAGLASRDEALDGRRRVLDERDEALGGRDGALGERDEARDERDEAIESRDEAIESRDGERTAARDLAAAIEQRALELGRARREVELLVAEESRREVLLAGSEPTLAEVASNLSRVRASRSWRWGQALARALRALTFRRGAGGSALDTALARLGVEADGGRERDERPA